MGVSAGSVLFAFALTVLAGLSTGIGSALAFYTKQTDHKFLSGTLGFSAGVMIYVSFWRSSQSQRCLDSGLRHRQGILDYYAGFLLRDLIDCPD